MENDLLVLEASSIVSGYRILNALPSTISVLDAEPTGGGRFLILLRGESAELHNIEKIAKDFGVGHELIAKIEQPVLDAVYSLASSALDESLIIIETETVGAMLSLAQTLATQHHVRAVEIRIRKSGSSGAYGYFTGTKKNCAPAAEDCRTRLKKSLREGDVEIFEEPNASIRSLFAGL